MYDEDSQREDQVARRGIEIGLLLTMLPSLITICCLAAVFMFGVLWALQQLGVIK